MIPRLLSQKQALQVLVDTLGLDGTQLKALMLGNVTATNLNDYGRFDKLKESVDKAKAKAKAKAYLEQKLGQSLIPPKVNIELNTLLREFILQRSTV
ncbi:hypothetical protein [Vibrio gigantis]|uniref:hypothetical protein n=1 Tax=Vibrio gigantis TaxID=296199 RepID=UPI001BFE3543|nr:hypothetical protein [Vibrio gigantis]